MDSFEWFGEIGNQLYDSLRPPGDINRETFCTARMGLESFGGGGGGGGNKEQKKEMKKQRKINDKANMNTWKYNWESAQKAWLSDKFMNDVKRQNQEVALSHKEAVEARGWQYQMAVRQHQYNAQVAAYNKSERLYAAQVNYNGLAARLAQDAALEVEGERLDAVMFQGMEADLKFSKAQADLAAKGVKADVGMMQKGSEIDMQKRAKTMERQAGRADAAFKAQSNLTQTLQQRGQVKAKGQAGRSADKTYQSVIADYGRASMQLADQVNRADSAYNLAMVGLDKSLDFAQTTYGMTKAEIASEGRYAQLGYDLGARQREKTKLSIGRAYEREIDKIVHDQYGANLRADAARMAKPGMPPAIPKPLNLPRALIVDRPKPKNAPKPIKGQGSPAMIASQGGGMSTGGMIGTGLSAAGSVAMMIPGGQLAGGIMMGLGAITSMF